MSAATEQQASSGSARSLFLSWEKLRIWYNLILSAVVVLEVIVSPPPRIDEVAFWWFLLECAFWANVCFCAGPCVEFILSWFWADHDIIREALFFTGTLWSCLLAFGAMLAWGMPQWD